MGSTTTSSSSSTQPTPTASDLQLQANEVGISNATQQGTINNDLQAQGLQGLIMQAGANNINQLVGGVSTAQSMNEAALANQSTATQNQAYGGGDTGANQQMQSANTANLLNQNSQFDISNLAQLMNLASGNAYQNVSNTSTNNSQANQIALGLTGSTSTGTSTTSANPFQEALQGFGDVTSMFKF